MEEQRVINKNQAENYKDEYDLDYFIETSAKTGMNAQEIFIEAARILYKDHLLYEKEKKSKDKDKDKNNIKKLNEKVENKKNKKCC